jgi:predicted metal-dependent enzyme (double-stranded beta helix superfamily)
MTAPSTRDGLAGLDRPLRELLERIAPHADLERPHLPAVADALLALAEDADYLAPRVAALGDTSGSLALHAPERGPRLLLVHRREAQMGAIHDHRVWVALAPVVGVETHRRYRRPDPSDADRIELAEDAALEPRTCVTLQPPDDIHEHGHLAGHGRPAHVLILLGDDQFRYARSEWDPRSGRRRVLEPGDRGRWLASDPVPDRVLAQGAP